METGLLGPAAKVSTALPNPNSRDPNKHVVCVYTADAANETDIKRVRSSLRDLGISWRIPYKTDQATRAGEYAINGSKRIATYYE